MAKVELGFAKDKETKGTWRYEELGALQVVGTLYIKKAAAAAFGGKLPDTLQVTIEVGE